VDFGPARKDEEIAVSVRIRLKRLGRKHRPFFRICATNTRAPRDGRVLEELGIYDPLVPETDARVTINNERLAYWLSVGALPSDKVSVLIKKYGPNGTRLKEAEAARNRLKSPKALGAAPVRVVLQPKQKEAPPAAPAESEAPAEG